MFFDIFLIRIKTKIFSTAYLVFKSEALGNNFLKTYDKTFIDHIGLVHKPLIEVALFQYFPNDVQPNGFENTYEKGGFLKA